MGDIVLRERAALAVLEPFLGNLVTADVEVPDVLTHTPEPDGLSFVDPDGVLGPRDFLNLRVSAADKLGGGLREVWRLQQVQGGKFATEPGQQTEQLQAPG